MAKQKIDIGDAIPAFRLQNQRGEWVSSEELLGSPFVLYFYPKDDTPGCTAEACAFRDAYEDFQQLGVQVVGISSDDPERHRQFAAKHHLPYLLLSDTGNQVRNAFGVPGSFFGLLPGRVTYVIDEAGVVRYLFNSQFNIQGHIDRAKAYLSGGREEPRK